MGQNKMVYNAWKLNRKCTNILRKSKVQNDADMFIFGVKLCVKIDPTQWILCIIRCIIPILYYTCFSKGPPLGSAGYPKNPTFFCLYILRPHWTMTQTQHCPPQFKNPRLFCSFFLACAQSITSRSVQTMWGRGETNTRRGSASVRDTPRTARKR